MNCLEAQEMFSLNYDNELSGQETLTLREHLESCPECSEEWNEWEKTFSALHLMGKQEILAPAGFSPSVMAKIKNEVHPARINRKRWKQAAIGTAAALLLVCSSVYLKPAPVTNIADIQPAEQSNYTLPDTNQKAEENDTLQVAAKDNGESPENITDSSMPDPKQPVQEIQQHQASPPSSAKFTSTEERIISSIFLKIEVDNAQASEQKAISLAQSQGASVQSLGQQAEGGKLCLVNKIIVSSSRAPVLLGNFSGLGKTISIQEQKEDFTSRYHDLVNLLISLEGQRDSEQNDEKIATLDKQIEQVKNQLNSWDKRAQEQTIVLWIQQ